MLNFEHLLKIQDVEGLSSKDTRSRTWLLRFFHEQMYIKHLLIAQALAFAKEIQEIFVQLGAEDEDIHS